MVQCSVYFPGRAELSCLPATQKVLLPTSFTMQKERFSLLIDRLIISVSTDLVYVGSHCPAAQELPNELKSFLDKSGPNGTVYIAFGTNVKWSFAPKTFIQSFKTFLTRLEGYRFVERTSYLKKSIF